MTQDPIIMRPQLQRWLGRHSDTVRKWMRGGRLPKPDVASQEDLERLLPVGVKVEKPGDEVAA